VVLFYENIGLLTELSYLTFVAPLDGLAYFECHR
jgi:hypothetical protein